MKVLLTIVPILLIIVSAQAQSMMVNGKVYEWNDPAWITLNDSLEIVSANGSDLVCRRFHWQTSSGIIHNHNLANPTTSLVQNSVKIYPNVPEIILRNHVGWPVGTEIKPPIKAIRFSIRKNMAAGSVDEETGAPLVIYDMGVAYFPPPKPLTPEQIAANNLKVKKTFADLLEKAEDGNPAARYKVGLCYLRGEGCETNHDEAVHWLQKAADAGYPNASNILAEMHN
jgi:TPR repeat protein